MRFSRLALAIASTIVAALPAKAATLFETTYGGWIVGAYSQDNTGAFSHCAASASYKSGTVLTFGLGTTGWMIGLSNQNWKMPLGASFPISLQIDQNQPITVTTHVASPDFAGATLETSFYLFQLFRRGRILKVRTARGEMIFELSGSARVLELVLSCANARMKPQSASTETNPFSDSSTLTGTQSRESSHTAETTAYLANVLSAAGIQGFALSPESKIGFWEVSWTAPNLVGLARIDEKSTVEESAILMAAGDSAVCKGNFASTKQPTADGKVMLLKTACQTSQSGQAFQYSYIIVPRVVGGSYITGVIESSSTASQDVQAPEVGPRLLEASHNYFESSRR